MGTLIVGPLKATQTQTLIIDTLDKCRDKEPPSALLSVPPRFMDRIPLVKFFIGGRPNPRIRSGFRLESLQSHADVFSKTASLLRSATRGGGFADDVERSSVDRAIFWDTAGKYCKEPK